MNAVPNEIFYQGFHLWTEHLNRFGIFHLDMQKMMAKIEYELAADI